MHSQAVAWERKESFSMKILNIYKLDITYPSLFLYFSAIKIYHKEESEDIFQFKE